MKGEITHRLLISLVSMVAVVFSCAVSAEPSEFDFTLAIEQSDYESEEFRFGRLFNREHGRLNGYYLRGGMSRESVHVQVEGQQSSGTVNYQGQNQLGIPIVSRTMLKYTQTGAQATYEFHVLPLFAGVAIQSREVDRVIQATPITQALHETLQQVEWGPVVGMTWHISNAVIISVQAVAFKTMRSSLAVDFLGTYDSGTLDLPDNNNRCLRLELRYKLTQSIAVVGMMRAQRFSPAQSEPALLMQGGVPVGMYSYPGSNQELVDAGIGVRVAW